MIDLDGPIMLLVLSLTPNIFGVKTKTMKIRLESKNILFGTSDQGHYYLQDLGFELPKSISDHRTNLNNKSEDIDIHTNLY